MPPSTDQILAIARAQRRTRATPEQDQAPGLAHPLPFTLTDLLPPERELFLRVFGASPSSRRKAVRAWQHKLRATREDTRTDTGRATPTRVRDERATAMTAGERDAAYEALPASAAALYRQLGACPISWFDIDMLAVLIDLDAPAAERLTRHLLEGGLLERAGDGFALGAHGHLHARVKAEASESEQRDLDAAGLERLLALLRDAAGMAARLIAPGRAPLSERDQPRAPGAAPFFLLDGRAALKWVDARTGVYLEAVRFAFAEQRYTLVCEDLVHWLWPLWLRRRRSGQLTEALTLALAAAELAHSERATAAMLIALADAARAVNPAAAYGYARRAATHCERTGDSAGLAAALSSLGSTLLDTGQFDQAGGRFRDAEALHAELGQARGVALARRGRGLIALERGGTETAVELLDDAHRALAQVGDRHEAALTLALHARALAADGDVRHALLELDLAAGVLREMRSPHGEAAVLSIRADVLAEAGFETQARQARAKARSVRRAAAPCAGHQDAESGDAC